LDLFICTGDGTGITGIGGPGTVWLNNGHGHFTDSKVRLQLDNSNSVAADIADLNKDGRTDIVVAKVKLDSRKGYVAIPSAVEIWINTLFQCNYLNEMKPGNIPLLFGSGIVSVAGENTHALAFSPDGSSLIFSRYPEKKSYIMRFTNNQWSNPVEAFFEGKEACFSPYGDKIYYYKEPGDICYNEKTNKEWGSSISMDSTINSPDMEYYPSVAYDGTLFFSRGMNWNSSKIMYSNLTDGTYSSPIDIGLPVNNGGALHAFIAPDKSYMIFNSPRKGSYTKLDLWLTFHNIDGSWTDPQNLGKLINSEADAILCPTITPDGKYLFFTKLTFSNSTGNVYWVSTDFIGSFKH
jgi:Tol biopolymer transport system component